MLPEKKRWAQPEPGRLVEDACNSSGWELMNTSNGLVLFGRKGMALKCPGPWPPDCSPPPTHQQLARGSTLPTQLQARPCSSLPGPVLVPSKAICPIPLALS